MLRPIISFKLRAMKTGPPTTTDPYTEREGFEPSIGL